MQDSNTPRIDRRRVLQGLGAAGIGGLLGAGAGTAAAQEQQNLLRMAQVKGPLEFDPIVLNDVPSAQVAGRVFDGLYTYDLETNVIPKMATGEPEVSEDGTTYTVTIKDEATFQNGDTVTAQDVKYTFEAPVKEETENASEVNMIDTVEVVDQKTARFQLSYPFAPFMNTLTFSVVPRSVREQDRERFNTQKPVGAGPFVFENWQEGSFVELSAWEDYWSEPKPELSGVRFEPIEEPTTRITSLRTGENDVIEEIPPKLYPQVRSMGNTSIEEVLGIGYFYLAFNCQAGPTADPTVREAIDYVFDMDQAVSNFVEPTGVRQYSPIPAPVAEQWGFPVEEWQQIPHGKDIDRARSMLQEAGVPDNWNANIIVPPDDKREQLGLTVANGIKEAGYNANVQRLDWGAFLEAYVSGDPNDYNMYTLGWSGVPDPDSFTYYFFANTEDVGGVTDGTFYNAENNSVSQKIIEARRTLDQEQRKTLYTEAITTMLQDRPHLPAYNLKNSFAVSSSVQDFQAHPVSSFGLATNYATTSVGASQ